MIAHMINKCLALQREKAKAQLRESQIENEEDLEASRLHRLQQEAVAAKQEVSTDLLLHCA